MDENKKEQDKKFVEDKLEALPVDQYNLTSTATQKKDFKKEYIVAASGLLVSGAGLALLLTVFKDRTTFCCLVILCGLAMVYGMLNYAIRGKQVVALVEGGETSVTALLGKTKYKSLQPLLKLLASLIKDKHLVGYDVVGGEKIVKQD